MDADDKPADVVVLSYEIAEGVVGFVSGLVDLLAQGVEGGVVLGKNDVISICSCREKPVDATCGKFFACDNFFEKNAITRSNPFSSSCVNVPPTASCDASTCPRNGLSQFGATRIGAWVIAFFNS